MGRSSNDATLEFGSNGGRIASECDDSRKRERGNVIAAPPERVWPLVTEARHFQAWYAFGGATIDLRPGGAMSLRWDEHGEFPAVVEAVVPGKLFSFRWLPGARPAGRASRSPRKRAGPACAWSRRARSKTRPERARLAERAGPAPRSRGADALARSPAGASAARARRCRSRSCAAPTRAGRRRRSSSGPGSASGSRTGGRASRSSATST